ncbi:MAG: hypothetical protein J4431_04420 [Candidatus Aenigmarchaeota archaeon]|nr:hypothetical protein [Candidatus Aenigmarchaeota archaeon]
MIVVPREVILSVILIFVAFMLMLYIFPSNVKKAAADTNSDNDIVVAFASEPDITYRKLGSGHEYSISMDIIAKYSRKINEETAARIDAVPVVEFKGKSAKMLVSETGNDYFTFTPESAEFKGTVTAHIVSNEPPIRDLRSNEFEGIMAPEESVVLKDTGSYQIKLSELRKKFLIAGECIAFFNILCENDAKTVQLKECKEGDLPSECNRIVGLCNGEIEISLGKIDCGKSAETKMIVKGGGGGEISETVHISFWNKGTPGSCVENAITYADLISRPECYNAFLGRYDAEKGLLEVA